MNKLYRIFTECDKNGPILNLSDLPLVESNLLPETIHHIEKSNLYLVVFADIIRQVLAERQSDNEIDSLFNKKVHDQNLVIGLIDKYRSQGIIN